MKKIITIVATIAIAILLLPMISSAVDEELLGPTISLDFDTTNNTVIFFFYNPNEETTMEGQFMMTIKDQKEIIEFSVGPGENFRKEMKPKESGTVHLQGWYQVDHDRYFVSLTRQIFLQKTPETGMKIPWLEVFIGAIVFVTVFIIAGIVMKKKK